MSKNDQSSAGPPPRKFGGMPFDWRRPTVKRVQSRMWNPKDHRFFTPKAFGWGYDVNFYWLAHPAAYVEAKRGA
jgi:hypothetical protein